MPADSVLGRLAVLISADTSGYDRNMNKVRRSLKKSSREFGQASVALHKSFTLPFAALSVASVRSFAKFDDAMTQSLAIMGNVEQFQKKNMVKAAEQVARTTTFSATQAAESYFFLASAGLDAEKSISALPIVAKFAQAGMFDMAQATDLLTDAHSALGDSTLSLVDVSDTLVKANTLANASVQQFSEALTNGAAAALKITNKNINEGVAVLAAFADQGVKGADAGTKFGIVMRDLKTKARNNAKEFKELGVEVFDSSGKMNHLADIIGDLEAALDGQSVEAKGATIANLGFADKSVKAISTLLGTSDKIRKYYEDLQNGAGATEEVAGKQLESFSSQVKLLRNELDLLAKGFGERMAPAVGDLVQGLRSASKTFTEMDPKLKDLIINILKFGALAAVATKAWSLFLAILAGTTAAIAAPIAAVAVLGAALFTFREDLKKANQAVEDFITGGLKNLATDMAVHLPDSFRKFLKSHNLITKTFEENLKDQQTASKKALKNDEKRRAELKKFLDENKKFKPALKQVLNYEFGLKDVVKVFNKLSAATKEHTKELTAEEKELQKLHTEFEAFKKSTDEDLKIKGFRDSIEKAAKAADKISFDKALASLRAALIEQGAKELVEKYKISFDEAAEHAGKVLQPEMDSIAATFGDSLKNQYQEAADFWRGTMEDAISNTRFDYKEQLKKLGVDVASSVAGSIFGKPGSDGGFFGGQGGGVSDIFGSLLGGGEGGDSEGGLLSNIGGLLKGVLGNLFGSGGGSSESGEAVEVDIDTQGIEAAAGDISSALEGGAFQFAIQNTLSEIAEIGKNTEETVEGVLTGAGAAIGSIWGPGGAALGSALGDIIGDPLGKIFRDHEDPQETARKDFRESINTLLDKLGGLTIFGESGPERLKSLEFNNGVFDRPGSAAIFQEIAGENVGSFDALGEGFRNLLGVAEDIGPQLGFILAENLSGNIDNARLLVQALDIDLEAMAESFVAAGLAGESSWHEVEVMLQGLTALQGKGLEQIGDITGAYELLTASAGRGAQALESLRILSIEAQEAGANSLQALQAQLLSSGQFTEDQIAKLFQSLEQRGITSLEDLENASDRTLGGVIADMESLGFTFDQVPESIHKASRAIEDLDDAIGRLPDKTKVEVEMLFSSSGSIPDSVVQQAANGLMAPSGITPFANGGIVSSPQLFAFAKGGVPSLGLMGEAGPEAIMPVEPGPDGKLGVRATGASGNNITVNIEVNGSGADVAQEIRNELEDYFDIFNTAPGVAR